MDLGHSKGKDKGVTGKEDLDRSVEIKGQNHKGGVFGNIRKGF